MLKYAGKMTFPPEEARKMQAAQADFKWWADNHEALWRQYRGQYIFIHNQQVVAAAPDPAEARRLADEACPDRFSAIIYMPLEIRKMIL